LGVHVADLPTGEMATGASVAFTFHWESGTWEGTNYTVAVE
jgi:hypothetical protein